jgi:hypothetical protein
MMSFDSLERRFGWLSFPGFLRYYIILFAMVYMLQIFRPEMVPLMAFDPERILKGEVWRLITFLFSPANVTGFGAMGAVFLFITVMLNFMISDSLESAWGVFRTSLFFHAGMLFLIVASWIIPSASGIAGYVFVSSAFLAFATLFPMVELLLFFIIPVQVRFFGWFLAAYLAFIAASDAGMGVMVLAGVANYLLWAGIPALRGTARVMEASKRRRRFKAAMDDREDAFHTCASCDRTDLSDPGLEFRVGKDGREYCVDHLRDN